MFHHALSRRRFLLRSAAAVGLTRTSPTLPQATGSDFHGIVGAWRVDAQGAPFTAHVMLFHADGTMLAATPEAGDPGASDSDGVGVWRANGNRVTGAFEEVVADRSTHHWIARIHIDFAVTVEMQAFHGTAHVTISGPDGTVLRRADVVYTATRIGCDTSKEPHA